MATRTAAKKATSAKVPAQRSKPAATPKAAPAVEPAEEFVPIGFLHGLAELLAQFGVGDVAIVKPATKASKATAKAAPADEDEDEGDEEGGDERADREAELKGMTLAKLRKIATDSEQFEDEDIAAANKATLVENILSVEFDDEEDEDADEEDDEDESDEDEDEEDDEEEEGYTREYLQGLTLVQVKKIAREEYEYGVGDLKGLDKDSIIDLILGDEEEDDEEGEDEYSREELEDMSDAELKELAKEHEIKVTRGMKRDAIIDALMEVGEDEEEDE